VLDEISFLLVVGVIHFFARQRAVNLANKNSFSAGSSSVSGLSRTRLTQDVWSVPSCSGWNQRSVKATTFVGRQATTSPIPLCGGLFGLKVAAT